MKDGIEELFHITMVMLKQSVSNCFQGTDIENDQGGSTKQKVPSFPTLARIDVPIKSKLKQTSVNDEKQPWTEFGSFVP